MARRLLKYILNVVALWASMSRAFSVELSVSSATATNDYVGKTVITVTGMAPSAAIRIEKFFDLNANGVIDASDALGQSLLIIDGAEPSSFPDGANSVRNWNIPADEDGAANGQIRVELPYPSLDGAFDFIAGARLFRVSDAANSFAPVVRSFTIKQRTLPQGVTGRITAAETASPLANAPVVLMPPDGSPVTGALTDGNGNYTLYSSPGEFVVMPMLPGYVGDFRAGMTSVKSGLATLNLSVSAATRLITGKLQDSSNGVGIPGVLLLAQSSAGQVTIGFSDSAGNFSLTVLAGQWEITPERGGLAALGYVGLGDNATVSVSSMTGNMSNVNLGVSKVNALIYGTLKDNQNRPVVGVQVWASESNGLYKTKGLSSASEGNFCLGVVAGNWQLQTDEGALTRLGYSSQSTSASVGINRAARLDIMLQRVTAHLRGRLREANGTPVGAMRIGVSDHASAWIMTETDENGQFDIGVSAGVWFLQLETSAAQERALLGPDLPGLNVVDGVDQNNILVTVLRVTSEIRGSVKTSSGNPIEGLGVNSSTTVNGTKYTDWNRTDSLGNYHLRTFNGPWQVDLDCNDLQWRGYRCIPSVQTNVTSGQVTVNLVVPTANPLRIGTSSLPKAKLGANYQFQLSASDGQPPYQWSLALGSAGLPPGLSLSSDGVISGAPAASGEFNFILNVRDNNLNSVSQTFGLTITGPATLSLPARLSSTQFRMNLNGDLRQTYMLQYSDTLTAWTTLLVTNAPMVSFPVFDQNATNAWRFYRVVVGP